VHELDCITKNWSTYLQNYRVVMLVVNFLTFSESKDIWKMFSSYFVNVSEINMLLKFPFNC